MSRKGQSTGMAKKRYSVEANPDICVVINPSLVKYCVKYSFSPLPASTRVQRWSVGIVGWPAVRQARG
jgi:hypothetical protein